MPAMVGLMALFAAVIVVWPQYGWPYWPVLMAVSAGLTVWGWRLNAWRAPLIVFFGYVAMRGVIWGLNPEVYEVASFLVWATAAILLYRVKAWIPGTAYLCSGAVYPLLRLFEFKLVYHGLAPILAEAFALFALITMGGGLYERTRGRHSSGIHPNRFAAFLDSFSLGVAQNKGRP